MRRLSIRLRLTLAFAVVMTIVLVASGALLYARLGAELDQTIDQGLRDRADTLAALVRAGDPAPAEHGDRFAQVIGPDGAVAKSTPGLGGRPLLSERQLEGARRQTTVVERDIAGDDDRSRLLATPVGASVAVVGASLEPRSEALETLLAQLLIGVPLAIVLSSLAGYGLATAALRPVESMRREAEAVSSAEPGRRLPLPPARDEVRRLGETLNAMLGRLELALERERRFVADASHELRTPLAALRTELELALRRTRTPEELENALRSAAEETDRLSQLAEDLLVLARSQGGKLPVRRERLDAATLLESVRDRFAHRAAEAGRDLELEVDDGLELSVDRLRAEQAVGNLIENALRHGRGRIVLRAQQNDGRVELHVRDQGPGFAPGLLEHAFEPFSRADPARSGRGAGPGLAIVDVIARAHGGEACVANREDGADAWLELPGDPD